MRDRSRMTRLVSQLSHRWFRICKEFSVVIIVTLLFASCNSPFQPEVNYTPKLNVYSVLFANERGVYVRVLPILKSSSDSISSPVRGASVTLTSFGPADTLQSVKLVDTTAIINGKPADFYYTPIRVIPPGPYFLSVVKAGFPTVTASVAVPLGYVTIPDENTYETFKSPGNRTQNIVLTAHLSGLASAAFAQVFIEYKGLDASGRLHTGVFTLTPVDSLDPFTEINNTGNPGEEIEYPLTVDISRYRYLDSLAMAATDSLRSWHMYVDIVVTQVDNNLYRFMITSDREQTPLLMRTDKIVFSDIFDNAGTGIVAGASVDTTRIFLF